MVAGTVSLAASNACLATDFVVSNASEISSAMNSARPGDVLIMTDGVWSDQEIDFAGDGTTASPITLRAETPGGVTLNDRSTLSISGTHLVVDGLNFEDGGDNSLNFVIQFRGSDGDASNCRLTNTQILNYNPSDPNSRYHWVNIYGQDNQVDHCQMQGQNHSGVTLVVVLNNNGQAARHLIDSNAFLDRPVGVTSNGFEGIRIGTSSRATTSAQCVVQNNLFDRMDGEIEIISNKSADNIYRYNTFRDSAGTLTLRHGKAARVESNFFLGEGRDRSGGIRVVDSDHVIINNYIEGIDDRADAAISLAAGISNTPASGYQIVRNVQILNNTIVNVNGAAVRYDWNFGATNNGGLQNQIASNVTFTNNLVRSSATALFEGQEGSNWTYDSNIVFGASLGISSRSGLMTIDPQVLIDSTGLFRPNASSPAINAGAAIAITDDMDGQARVGAIDIGADEFSAASIVRTPLTREDVGPVWTTTTEPPPMVDPPEGNFLAIQAEDFTSATDPDGDGDTWTVVDDPDALDSRAIEAPSGSRTNLPSQDALALYNLTFNEAGNFTAYYRSRGTSGSSDSFYSPSNFGVDPTVNESTSNNGSYTWVTGEQFTVPNAGVAFELRIGRREGLNRIDAIVFHEDDSLTDLELDALFADAPETPDILVGDVNLDESVNFLDISPFITRLATSTYQAEADIDQNGVVNFLDISRFVSLLSGR